jgi:uncharacterized protein (DUF983 family)
MISNNKKVRFIRNIFNDKCPRCAKGYVFKQDVSIFKIPIMHATCETCNYHFDREPGYFLGAMYISYALAVLQGILTYILLYLTVPSLSTFYEILIIILVIILFARKNYKLSRIIYIHIFPW